MESETKRIDQERENAKLRQVLFEFEKKNEEEEEKKRRKVLESRKLQRTVIFIRICP